MPKSELELLAPARDADIGIEAINHGADAVYIGGPGFGARDKASNSVADIERLCTHAHRYGARIFVTHNTILRDDELDAARQMAWDVYHAGADALIVQDMGLPELDLPPIQLHASTQTDIRTPEKARFLQDVGFSQMVLARELSLPQIRAIQAKVQRAVLEFFIHGALCVAYSGQCNISHAHTGRSDNLLALVEAGIRCFKIEGRYKDMATVKNVTAHYRQLVDRVLEQRSDLVASSAGRCNCTFTPDPERGYNRGGTDYFVNGRQIDIGAFDTPKHAGMPLGEVLRVGADHFDVQLQASDGALHNGDALTWWDLQGELQGVPVNVAQPLDGHCGSHWRVTPNLPPGTPLSALKDLKRGTALCRNRDMAWDRLLAKPSAQRQIGVDLYFSDTADGFALDISDEQGHHARVHTHHRLEPAQDAARTAQTVEEQLRRLGGTTFAAGHVQLTLSQPWFVPSSVANHLRRGAVVALRAARAAAFTRLPRAPAVHPPVPYPEDTLSYLANVHNQKAADFYARHGVKVIGSAYESHEALGEVSLMITKHCVRWSLSLCPKQAKGVVGVQGTVRAEPLTLKHGDDTLTLRFDCKPCEMHVVGKMRKNVLQQARREAAAVPVRFYKTRPVPEKAAAARET